MQPLILESNKLGVVVRTHADSLENNISEDSRSQPSLKDHVIKYSQESQEVGDL